MASRAANRFLPARRSSPAKGFAIIPARLGTRSTEENR
jgi:hypothetical protein